MSCRALEDVQRDRARLDKHWKQRLERARYEAEDAERRYRAVDPDYAQFPIMQSPVAAGHRDRRHLSHVFAFDL